MCGKMFAMNDGQTDESIAHQYQFESDTFACSLRPFSWPTGRMICV